MATSARRKKSAGREHKRERIELRVAASAKQLIKRAMALSGLTAGDLAYEGAPRAWTHGVDRQGSGRSPRRHCQSPGAEQQAGGGAQAASPSARMIGPDIDLEHRDRATGEATQPGGILLWQSRARRLVPAFTPGPKQGTPSSHRKPGNSN